MTVSIVGHRHSALVVENIDAVLSFYTRLGFQIERRDLEQGDFISHLIGHPQVRLESAKLRLPDGYRLELIKFFEPGSRSDSRDSDVARLGFHHLAFTVSNIQEAIAVVLANGGAQISAPRATDPGLPSIHAYVADCEGNWIHLAENIRVAGTVTRESPGAP